MGREARDDQPQPNLLGCGTRHTCVRFELGELVCAAAHVGVVDSGETVWLKVPRTLNGG